MTQALLEPAVAAAVSPVSLYLSKNATPPPVTSSLVSSSVERKAGMFVLPQVLWKWIRTWGVLLNKVMLAALPGCTKFEIDILWYYEGHCPSVMSLNPYLFYFNYLLIYLSDMFCWKIILSNLLISRPQQWTPWQHLRPVWDIYSQEWDNLVAMPRPGRWDGWPQWFLIKFEAPQSSSSGDHHQPPVLPTQQLQPPVPAHHLRRL